MGHPACSPVNDDGAAWHAVQNEATREVGRCAPLANHLAAHCCSALVVRMAGGRGAVEVRAGASTSVSGTWDVLGLCWVWPESQGPLT